MKDVNQNKAAVFFLLLVILIASFASNYGYKWYHNYQADKAATKALIKQRVTELYKEPGVCKVDPATGAVVRAEDTDILVLSYDEILFNLLNEDDLKQIIETRQKNNIWPEYIEDIDKDPFLRPLFSAGLYYMADQNLSLSGEKVANTGTSLILIVSKSK